MDWTFLFFIRTTVKKTWKLLPPITNSKFRQQIIWCKICKVVPRFQAMLCVQLELRNRFGNVRQRTCTTCSSHRVVCCRQWQICRKKCVKKPDVAYFWAFQTSVTHWDPVSVPDPAHANLSSIFSLFCPCQVNVLFFEMTLLWYVCQI